MSAQRSTRRTCRGKFRYHDHAEAVGALHRIGNRSTRAVIPCRAYACSHCAGWHLTSQTLRSAA